MKTNEELQGMTHDELVAYTQNLQRESEEYRKSMLYYMEEAVSYTHLTLPTT